MLAAMMLCGEQMKKGFPGRPTKFSFKYCEQIVSHMGSGGSLTSFAAKVGVSRETLYQWALTNVHFSDAFKRGQAALELWFEELFKRMATGQLPPRLKSEVTSFDKEGHKTVTKVFEYPTGNAASAIFMAQNMIHWRHRKDIQMTGDSGGPIKYSDLTETEMRKIIKDGLEVLGYEIP